MERPFFHAFSSMGAGFRALGASLRRMEERRRTRDKGRFHNSSDETYRGKAACAGRRGPGWPFLGAEPYTGAGPLDSPEC